MLFGALKLDPNGSLSGEDDSLIVRKRSRDRNMVFMTERRSHMLKVVLFFIQTDS